MEKSQSTTSVAWSKERDSIRDPKTRMNDLPAVQSLWMGERLSKMEKMSVNSFLEKGHDFHLYTYGDIENVPRGTKIKDAREVIPRKGSAKYGSKGSATFANIFRYKLLSINGGVWVDMDIISVRPFKFDKEYLFASERVERQSKWSITLPVRPVACVMKTPKGSEIMEYCYERSKNKDPEAVEWGKIGTDLVEHAVSKFDLVNHVSPFWSFCPISWWNWREFINKSIKIRVREKMKRKILRPYAYHLWHSRWSENSVNKEKKYSQQTIYGSLQKKFL